MKREAAVAGTFYSDERNTLKLQVDELLKKADKPLAITQSIRALIVPHAGYVYSGEVAAEAYKRIEGATFETVFLIGTSHKAKFNASALCHYSAFLTPLGDVSIATEIVDKLCQCSGSINKSDDVHLKEHSLEVQLPFLQRCLSAPFRMVPVLIGTDDLTQIHELSDALRPYFNKSNLFVISTDFSHYPSAEVASMEDKNTADCIIENNTQKLLDLLDDHQYHQEKTFLTGLCGWSAVLCLLNLTENKDVDLIKLKYQNSGDKLNMDQRKVVGYQSMVVVDNEEGISISTQDAKMLLSAAHQAINQRLNNTKVNIDHTHINLSHAGAFVSVYYNEQLRGCVGQFKSAHNILSLIKELAVDAALYDDRFKAILASELQGVRVEISILTPLKKIESIEEIEVGRHGVYIKKGMQHGTFLPQVGIRNNWSTLEFLGHCSKNKAKLGWDGWKEAEVYIYEALIIADDKNG